MKRFVLALAAGALLAATAQAADFEAVVRQVDQDASVEIDGSMYIVVTSAPRVTPHDPPYTAIVQALCAQRAVLEEVDQVVVLNRHAFKGVAFWHYDDYDDLAGACEAIDAGLPAGAFAVMR